MTTLAICTDRDDPADAGSWSGTPANLIAALEGLGIDVVPVGPLGGLPRWGLQRWAGVTGRLGRRTNWEVEPLALRYMGGRLAAALRHRPVDAVVTMGWYPLLGARTELPPVFYYGDAHMAARLDNSPFWSHISRRTRRRAVTTERLALASLSGAFMSSRWAADGLVETAGMDRDRVRHVPFGANVTDPGEVDRSAPDGRSVRLLAVGVQWHRKGLDRAVLAADELSRRGVDVHLDVAGALPPEEGWERPWVTYHGFVDTRTTDGRELRDRLYREADVFVLPTQYDPFCIALSEAHAYSLPVVVTAVNGITERITDQGVLVDRDASPVRIADAVQQSCADYDRQVAAARATFLRDANWAQSARLLVDHVEELRR
ncbi:glycosyltransferase family 4 protein [Nocardioides marmoraquaticus]